MKRKFRLTRSSDIQRVRRVGNSIAHPLVVLVVNKTDLTCEKKSRIAFITGRSVGGAVERNRVRRRLKAICEELLPELKTSFEALIIGRAASSRASFEELNQAVQNVFRRAGLTKNMNE